MTIKTFIEKAWKGGYKPSTELQSVDRAFVHLRFKSEVCEQPVCSWMIERVFLDPEAWKAVGKVEDWGDWACMECGFNGRPDPNLRHDCGNCTGKIYQGWIYHMHRMIDAIADGKTITEFLETL